MFSTSHSVHVQNLHSYHLFGRHVTREPVAARRWAPAQHASALWSLSTPPKPCCSTPTCRAYLSTSRRVASCSESSAPAQHASAALVAQHATKDLGSRVEYPQVYSLGSGSLNTPAFAEREHKTLPDMRVPSRRGWMGIRDAGL